MSSSPSQKASLNRTKILKKADELIYKKGYHQTSFGDIAKAVGIAKGNFYYYFKSKEDILDGIVNSRVENIKIMLATWDKEIVEPKDRIKRFIGILDNERRNIVQFGCPIGSLFVELGKQDKHLQSNIKVLFEVFIDWLESQFELIGTKTPKLLAKDLVAKVQGVALLVNVLNDEDFIDRSITEIGNWVDLQV